jgi:hypothetical protein
MAPTTPVSLAARQRLQVHQAAAAKAVAAHASALARLDTIISRRAKVIADQDTVIAAARSEVEAAVVTVVQVMGVANAAEILNLSAKEVRHITKDAKRPVSS